MAERIVRVKLAAQVDEYKKGMLEAANATRTVGTANEKLAQQKQAFEQMGRGLAIAGGALTAVTALSVKAAMDWESAWAGVTKTVEGTPEQLAAVEDGLRGLTSVLPASHSEIAAVAEAAGQLGIETDNVVAFTETMINLGETTNLSANDAATAIARFTNIMGTSQDEADNLGSAIVGLGNNYATTEREILEMSMRLAGAGKQIGLTEGDVLGLATALSSVGIEAEAGGSAMSKVMIDIASSVDAGGERLEMFAKVAGMSADAFANQWRTAPAEALSAFVKGLSNAEAQGSSTIGVLSELGITEVRMRDALLRSSSAADMFAGAMERGNEEFELNNALTTEAAKRYATVESKLAIAGNAVRDAAIDFGEVFLPAVGAAAEAVAGFADFMGGLPDPVQGVIGVLTGLVGVTALVGGTALMAVPKIVEFKLAMDTLGLSMKTIGLVGGGAMVALTALVAVVGTLAAEQARAQQRAESYMSTLAEGTQAVTRSTREMAKEALAAKNSFLWMEQDSAYDAANKLGISLDLVTDAAMGNAKALEELQKQIDAGADGSLAYANSAVDIENAVRGEAESIEKAIEMAKQKESADKRTKSSTESLTDATEEMTAATETATRELDDLKKVLDEIGGTAMDAGAAIDAAQSAVNRLGEAAKEEGVTLDGTNSASIALRDSMRDVEQAHRDAAQAILDNGGTFEDARDEWNKGREAIIRQVEAMGMSRAEAEAWADKNMGSAAEVVQALGSVKTAADQVKSPPPITISVLGYSEAYSYLTSIQSRLREISGNSQLRIATGAGGQGGTTAYANGGIEDYAFASGNGIDSGIFRGGPPIYKFAEPETGWEAFISGKPSEKQRNIGIWQETGRRLGVDASAGSGPVQVSLAGAEFTMWVDGQPMRAVIQEQIVQADRGSGVAVRGGKVPY